MTARMRTRRDDTLDHETLLEADRSLARGERAIAKARAALRKALRSESDRSFNTDDAIYELDRARPHVTFARDLLIGKAKLR